MVPEIVNNPFDRTLFCVFQMLNDFLHLCQVPFKCFFDKHQCPDAFIPCVRRDENGLRCFYPFLFCLFEIQHDPFHNAVINDLQEQGHSFAGNGRSFSFYFY